MKTASVKQTKRFMAEISKLAPEEFLGLAKVLCVQLFNEDKSPRDFYEILGDVIERFARLGKSQRKEIMTVLKAVNDGGERNGNETTDSKTES